MTDNNQTSGWNQGFFGGDVNMAELERGIFVNGGDTRDNVGENDNATEREPIMYTNNEKSDLELLYEDDVLEEGKPQNPGLSGWNYGFFYGQQGMSEKERANWMHHTEINNEDLVDKDLGRSLDMSELDDEINHINMKNELELRQLTNRQNEMINTMIFSNASLDDVPFLGKKRHFVEKENYDKFLNIKKSSDLLNVYVEVFLIALYTMVFVVLLGLQYFTKKSYGLGLLVIPIIMITMYKSINSYSLIKLEI